MASDDTDKSRKHRIAIVLEDLSDYSGVSAVGLFIYRLLVTSGRYAPEIISLSSSVRDPNSRRILAPSTWFRKTIQTRGECQGVPYIHLGAVFTELEFQRYRPRAELTKLFNEFELVQIVCGCAPWGFVARNYTGIVALHVASLSQFERHSMLKSAGLSRRAWLWLMTKINIALESPAFRRADLVFVENNWMRERLNTDHGAENVILAPPGVDTNVFLPRIYQENGYLLSVGRFGDPRKNVMLLFEAFRRLRELNPDAPRLVLAGETVPSPEHLAYAESVGILPYLEIHQGVSLEKLRTLYQNASLFLLASNEEGFGFVIAEAMACGLPVVSTQCKGPETLVVEGETGHLTPVGDAEAMCMKIKELLDDPNRRRQMSIAARRRAVEEFSIETTSRVYLNSYDKLLSVNARR